jgi:hypothetical protein
VNARDRITVIRNGPHQAALRRMSVKVLLGAMKVSTMRAGSERAIVSSAGVIGAELIRVSLRMKKADCNAAARNEQERKRSLARCGRFRRVDRAD